MQNPADEATMEAESPPVPGFGPGARARLFSAGRHARTQRDGFRLQAIPGDMDCRANTMN